MTGEVTTLDGRILTPFGWLAGRVRCSSAILAVELNGSAYGRVFSIAHTNPYFTVDGISRSLNAGYVERERMTASFSQFSTKSFSAGFGIGYPLSENQFVNFGLSYSHEDLATVFSSSTQLRKAATFVHGTSTTTPSGRRSRTASSPSSTTALHARSPSTRTRAVRRSPSPMSLMSADQAPAR